jgi:CBS domain-containing protein
MSNSSLKDKKIKEVSAFRKGKKDFLRCVSPTHTVGDVLLEMEVHEINHLPVTVNGHANEKLVGIISRRDLNRNLSSEPEMIMKEVQYWMASLSGDYSNPEDRQADHVLSEEDTIEQAITHLLSTIELPGKPKKRISALVVVDKDSNVVGITSYKDIMAEIQNSSDQLRFFEETSVKKLMKSNLTTVIPEAPFSSVFTLFYTKGYRSLPVADENMVLKGLINDISVFLLQRSDSANSKTASDPALMFGIRDLHLIYPERPVQESLSLFLKRPYHTSLLVVDSKSSPAEPILTGILSYVDILQYFLDSQTRSE